MREARQSPRGDGNRQKARAAGRVISRVICPFSHEQAGAQARSS
jgi:hypothetical protein